MAFDKVAADNSLQKATKSLVANGFVVITAVNGAEAKEKLFSLVPEGAEVMQNTSTTLDQIGVSEELIQREKHDLIKQKFAKMDRATQGKQMKSLGSTADYAIGSVHAITEDGKMLIASGTGSQLPGYAYGSDKIIFVAGTHKIVKDLDEGIKRIYEYTLPLENERATKVYGHGSSVNKLLILNKEPIPGRITVILVEEVLGF